MSIRETEDDIQEYMTELNQILGKMDDISKTLNENNAVTYM